MLLMLATLPGYVVMMTVGEGLAPQVRRRWRVAE
jgi:ribosomal protein L39E